jgi:hypothetical protein
MKKALSILLSFLLVFGTVAFSLTAAAEAPTIIDQGYCGGEGDGTNVTWVLTNDGTLTISGEGEAATFRPSDSIPWCSYDNQVQSLVIENGVTVFNSWNLFGCNELTSIDLPASLQGFSLGDYLCAGSELLEIHVDSDNPNMKSQDGILLSKDGTKLLAYPVGRHFAVIPEGVTDIGRFYGADILSVVIPEGVERIYGGTFSECFNLARISMPLSMKCIEDAAFYETFAISIVEYHGTQEQWDQISIELDENIPTHTNYKLHEAYRAYAEGHDVIFEDRVTQAPTCFEEGEKELMLCYTPGTTWSHPYRQNFVTILPALNHCNAYDVPATEATATEHGYTAGVWCPDCNTWRSGHAVIHNHLGQQTVLQAPTATEDGLVDIVCTVCGEHGQYTVSATGPQPGDNGSDSGSSGGFWQRITGFFRGIIDWFLRLFKWFGK